MELKQSQIARLFNRTGAGLILLYISKNKEVHKIDFRKKIGLSSATAVKSQNMLFDVKLIKYADFSYHGSIILTEKGEKIAKHLDHIQNILNCE